LENKLKNDKENQDSEKKLIEKNTMDEEKMKSHENSMIILKNMHEENMKIINSENKLYRIEDIISVNFTSTDQKINYSFPCAKNEIFAVIEEKLYKEYPEYRETNNYFVQKGQQILRFKTLEENKINPGFPILLIKPIE